MYQAYQLSTTEIDIPEDERMPPARSCEDDVKYHVFRTAFKSISDLSDEERARKIYKAMKLATAPKAKKSVSKANPSNEAPSTVDPTTAPPAVETPTYATTTNLLQSVNDEKSASIMIPLQQQQQDSVASPMALFPHEERSISVAASVQIVEQQQLHQQQPQETVAVVSNNTIEQHHPEEQEEQLPTLAELKPLIRAYVADLVRKITGLELGVLSSPLLFVLGLILAEHLSETRKSLLHKLLDDVLSGKKGLPRSKDAAGMMDMRSLALNLQDEVEKSLKVKIAENRARRLEREAKGREQARIDEEERKKREAEEKEERRRAIQERKAAVKRQREEDDTVVVSDEDDIPFVTSKKAPKREDSASPRGRRTVPAARSPVTALPAQKRPMADPFASSAPDSSAAFRIESDKPRLALRPVDHNVAMPSEVKPLAKAAPSTHKQEVWQNLYRLGIADTTNLCSGLPRDEVTLALNQLAEEGLVVIEDKVAYVCA